MRKMKYLLVVLLFNLALSLAACGGGSGASSSNQVQAGKDLFSQSVIGSNPGCATCHSMEEGVVLVGPSLAHIATDAQTMVSGTSAQDYITQSILDPDAFVVQGFVKGVMPANWKDVLTQEQVNDLVAYLMTLK